MKEYLKMFTEFRGVVVEPTMGGSLSLHGCKAYYAAHAINSHDELVEMNKMLLAALEGRIELMDRMGIMGNPPHMDYWNQSLYITEKSMRDAIARANGGAA